MTINLDQLLKYCNFLINKSQAADAISPDEFNVVLPVVNQEVFNDQIKKVLQVYGQPSFLDAYKNSYLRDCEDIYTNNDINDTYEALPTGFEMYVSAKAKIATGWVPVRFIESVNAFNNVDGMVTANDEYVSAWIVGSGLHFNNPVEKLQMIYIKNPVNPFYDYCLYEYEAIFLPVGAIVEHNGGGSYTYDNNVFIYNNVTQGYLGQFVGMDYNSRTVEFTWNDKLIPQITNLIFEKMGINIREQIPIEVAQMKKGDK